MASSAPRPTDTRPRPATGPRKHPTLIGKIGHAGFHFSKHTLQLLGIVLGILLLIVIASFFVDEPMRRAMEKNINRRLTGYTAHIQKVDFHLIGLSVTLRNVSISQDAYPNPPVALLPRLHASVQWSELLKLKLVSDFQFDRPQIYVNLLQLRKEATDAVPLHKKGWQDAAYAIYPLKINLLQLSDGTFTYIDKDPARPLKVTHLFFRANNIRNIRSADRVYPSPVHAEGIVFGTGRAEIDGHANFLAQPYLGFNTLFSFESVPLDYFRPMLSRHSNLEIHNGFLTTHGQVEFAPTVKTARIEDLLIDRLSGANLRVMNLSNKTSEGRAVADLTGNFMGSGKTVAHATFRPQRTGADFDLNLKIEDTQMTAMNDLWRAYGKFDVVGGEFSVYTQLKVKDGRINGYVKPLFKDMKVYDKEQDKNKTFFKKLYEKTIEGLSKLLRNKKRQEVVTVADISGPVSSPHASPTEIISKLLENAFVKAILPGFEREVAGLLGRAPSR